MDTLENALIKLVGKVIIIFLIDKENIFEVISHIVILTRFIEILFKSPKNLSDHNLGAKVVKP